MHCTVCNRELTNADKPLIFDVHDVQPDGELKTGFRVVLCPPSLGEGTCELKFRVTAKQRKLTLIPLEPPDD